MHLSSWLPLTSTISPSMVFPALRNTEGASWIDDFGSLRLGQDEVRGGVAEDPLRGGRGETRGPYESQSHHGLANVRPLGRCN